MTVQLSHSWHHGQYSYMYCIAVLSVHLSYSCELTVTIVITVQKKFSKLLQHKSAIVSHVVLFGNIKMNDAAVQYIHVKFYSVPRRISSWMKPTNKIFQRTDKRSNPKWLIPLASRSNVYNIISCQAGHHWHILVYLYLFLLPKYYAVLVYNVH